MKMLLNWNQSFEDKEKCHSRGIQHHFFGGRELPSPIQETQIMPLRVCVCEVARICPLGGLIVSIPRMRGLQFTLAKPESLLRFNNFFSSLEWQSLHTLHPHATRIILCTAHTRYYNYCTYIR